MPSRTSPHSPYNELEVLHKAYRPLGRREQPYHLALAPPPEADLRDKQLSPEAPAAMQASKNPPQPPALIV